MSGISVKVPLSRDDLDGIALNKSLVESVRQNLKMLILTRPGERPMDVEFGVGLFNYVFENDSHEVRGSISSRIYQQVQRYLPFVSINNIVFASQLDNARIEPNLLSVKVEYTIVPLNYVDNIALTTEGDEIMLDGSLAEDNNNSKL